MTWQSEIGRQLSVAFGTLGLMGREYPEELGKRVYERARQLLHDRQWQTVRIRLYDDTAFQIQALGFVMQKVREQSWPWLLNMAAKHGISAADVQARLQGLPSKRHEIAAEMVSEGLPEATGDEFREFVDQLIEDDEAAIYLGFAYAVGLRHALTHGREVSETYSLAAAGGDDADEEWRRLITIDPMVMHTAAFCERVSQASLDPEDDFLKAAERWKAKHAADRDWELGKRLEAVMRDLLSDETVGTLRHEDVFQLAEETGGSYFRDHISLRAESSKARNRSKLELRSKHGVRQCCAILDAQRESMGQQAKVREGHVPGICGRLIQGIRNVLRKFFMGSDHQQAS